MTDQERQQAFIDRIQQAEREFGYTVRSVLLYAARNGEFVPARADLEVTPIVGWQAPEPTNGHETEVEKLEETNG